MTFIEFRTHGRNVFVNIDKILFVTNSAAGYRGAEIHLEGTQITVEQTPNEVIDQIVRACNE